MYAKLFVRRAHEHAPTTRNRFGKIPLSACAAACAIALGLADSATARVTHRPMSEAEALGVYIQVNGFDVETGLLGRAQASSASVRALAAQVAADHLGVRQTAFDLAAACKVVPVVPNDRAAAAIEHGRSMATLAALHGLEFDRAYMQHEVAFHRAAIEAVRRVLQPSATCPALKTHFNAVLPAMEHHLSETEALTRELTAR